MWNAHNGFNFKTNTTLSIMYGLRLTFLGRKIRNDDLHRSDSLLIFKRNLVSINVNDATTDAI